MSVRLPIAGSSYARAIPNDAAKPKRKPDILVLVGPDIRQCELKSQAVAAENRGLTMQVIGDGHSPIERSDLPLEVADDAHVMVSCHGELLQESPTILRHKVQVGLSGYEFTRSFIADLRARWPNWKGLFHLSSCHAGALKYEYRVGDEVLGDCLLYASSKRKLLKSTNEDALSEVCQFIVNEKRPPAMEVFTRAVFSAEECLTAFGPAFEGSLTVHAPKKPSDLTSEALERDIESAQEDQSNPRVSRKIVVGTPVTKQRFLQQLRSHGERNELRASFVRTSGSFSARMGAGDKKNLGGWIQEIRRLTPSFSDFQVAAEALHAPDPILALKALEDLGIQISAPAFPEMKDDTILNHIIDDNVDFHVNTHCKLVDFLIKKGCPINGRDNEGLTLLHKAARAGETEFMDFLIRRGAGVNTDENEEVTPLGLACSSMPHVRRDAVELLIRRGANVNDGRKKPLYFAIKSVDFYIVEQLLKHGANPRCEINAGENASNVAFGLEDTATRLRMISTILKNIVEIQSPTYNSKSSHNSEVSKSESSGDESTND